MQTGRRGGGDGGDVDEPSYTDLDGFGDADIDGDSDVDVDACADGNGVTHHYADRYPHECTDGHGVVDDAASESIAIGTACAYRHAGE